MKFTTGILLRKLGGVEEDQVASSPDGHLFEIQIPHLHLKRKARFAKWSWLPEGVKIILVEDEDVDEDYNSAFEHIAIQILFCGHKLTSGFVLCPESVEEHILKIVDCRTKLTPRRNRPKVKEIFQGIAKIQVLESQRITATYLMNPHCETDRE